jgi:hypothetical protein
VETVHPGSEENPENFTPDNQRVASDQTGFAVRKWTVPPMWMSPVNFDEGGKDHMNTTHTAATRLDAPARTRSRRTNRPAEPAADPREAQLTDIAASGDEDAAECAAADLFREFPDLKG